MKANSTSMDPAFEPVSDPVRLSVNVNKVATLRNARGGIRPDPVWAALQCMEAGADGITVHPRPDERHIRRDDVRAIARALEGRTGALGAIELNIEGYPSPSWIDLVLEIQPAQATLVPDPPDVLTSNAGWDLADGSDFGWLAATLRDLRAAGVRTSLFLDPEPELVACAADLGADRIELYTESWARSAATDAAEVILERYRSAALAARANGLLVNAGHDLDLQNLSRFAAVMPGLAEVSIGHALIADALEFGLHEAVRRYLSALER